MNQAVSFGLLLGGGILLTSALTGSSLADVVQGHPGSISTTSSLTGATGVAANGVAGVGSTLTSGLSAFLAAGKNSLGYVNPFAQASMVTPERVDQGQDFSLAPGSPILAPGNSTFLGSIANWYSGQPYLGFKLTSGPLAGQNYYVAEQVTPAAGLRPGASVAAGQPIAHYASSGTGLEIGWAGTGNDWQQTLAQQQGATNPGQGHANTPAGQEFHQFLADIGAVS